MEHGDIEHMAQGYPPAHIAKDSEEVIVWLATQLLATQEQRDALAAENAGMDSFIDALLSIAWQGGSADGAEIQAIALKHGLIRQESYSADTHESLVEDPGNFEEGDDVYFRVETPVTDAWLNSVRAEGVDYIADSIGAKCSELKIGSKDWKALKSTVFMLGDFSAKLRAGEPS